jgi:hypothetical protein
MYLMLRGSVTDGHDSLSFTSLSLINLFVNVVYVRTLILLMNTFCHAWSRHDTLRLELHYIVVFDLYAVSMTLVDAT